MVLHGVTAVAELKHRQRRCTMLVLGVLHGVTAVAELKRLTSATQAAASFGSPRRHRRGRIEAPAPGVANSCCRVVLHGVTAVAELKLSNCAIQLVHFALFSTASPPWPN